MKEAEIIIEERYCTGCGYCQIFCPKNCIEVTGKKISPDGYSLPTLTNEDECSACGICACMCPSLAIEVFRISSN